MLNKWIEFPIKELCELYESGYTHKQLAIHFGVHHATINRFMLRIGIKGRHHGGKSRPGAQNPRWKGGIRYDKRSGYVRIFCPNHPRASGKSCVLMHVFLMEQHLGRFLVWKGSGHPETEIVHHKNGNRADNRIANLELTTFQKHQVLHAAMRKAAKP